MVGESKHSLSRHAGAKQVLWRWFLGSLRELLSCVYVGRSARSQSTRRLSFFLHTTQLLRPLLYFGHLASLAPILLSLLFYSSRSYAPG